MARTTRRFRARQRVGQYRIESCVAIGGFSEVYRAYDTVEGIRVALKIPHAHLTDAETLESFKREVRLVARLDHPNVLPIKTAGFIGDAFIVVQPLGKEALSDRLARRIGTDLALDYAEQLLEALAHAHAHKVIHCDVKPDNILIFDGGRLKLADFGLARVAVKTILGSGSGTVGYLAPEQALGKPSPRSDVFSGAMVIYKMLTGQVAEWPFRWPYPGADRLRRRVNPDLEFVLRKATAMDEDKRYPDAGAMLRAFRRARRKKESDGKE